MRINAARLIRPAYFVFAILCSLLVLNIAAPEQPTLASSAPSKKVAASAPQTFTPPPLNYITAASFDTGGPSNAAATADFNKDGKLDVLVSINGTGGKGLRLLTGNGDSTFQPPVNITSDPNYNMLVAGDFNGDGKPDFAAATGGTLANTGIKVFLGNGDGTFQAPYSFDSGMAPAYIGTVDVNNDGKQDIVTSNSYSPSIEKIRILLGNGDGTFQPAISYDVPGTPIWIATGDLNKDGKPDLVLTSRYSVNLSIFIGNGDGTFQSPTLYNAGAFAVLVTIADMNGDEKLDLIILTTSNLSVVPGNGDGTFGAAKEYPGTTRICRPIVIADFNEDGTPDIAVNVDFGGTANVSILLGNGDGSVRLAGNYDTGQYLEYLLGGDFNGDGKDDVVTANQSLTVSVLPGNGDGTLRAPFSYRVGLTPSDGATGDLNGDGKADIVSANYDSNDTSVLLNNGDGTFKVAVNYPVGKKPEGLVLGDFNGDNKQDVITANYGDNNLSFLAGKGDGTFFPAINIAAPAGPQAIAAGDINQDGKLDLVVTSGSSNSLAIFTGNGDGTFLSPVTVGVGVNPYSVVIYDVNGDGRLDILTAGGGSGIGILLGKGDGTFQPVVFYPTGGNAYQMAIGDLNDDGNLDIAIMNYFNATVSVLPGKGDGTFQPFINYYNKVSSCVTIADLNGDGLPDLVIADYYPGSYGGVTFEVMLNNADGTLQAPMKFNIGQMGIGSIMPGDFNSDGKTDLAVVNTGTPDIYPVEGYVSVLLATGNKETTKIEVNSSANPAYSGQNITLTATVSAAASGKGTPSGTVTFKDGFATLGTSTITNGVAIFSTSTLAAGSHSITAEYSGDAGFNPAVSNALTQVVDPATLVKVIDDNGLADTPYTFSFALSQANAGPVKTVVFDPTLSAVNVAGNPLFTIGAGVKIEGRCSLNGNGPLVTITGARLALNGGVTLEGLELRGAQVQLHSSAGTSANRLNCVKVNH